MGAVLGLCSAAQLACCCGSTACSLCAACPACRNSTSTRIMYAIMLLLGTVVGCIMLAPGLQDQLKKVPFCEGSVVSTGFDCSEAVGYLAVYRLCFALAIFYTLMCILMIGVKSSKDPRGGIQNGFWGLKYLVVIALAVGAFFIPEDSRFATTWLYFGMIGGFLFIIIQLILIIDFAHSWAERWVSRYEETESKKWYAALLFASAFNYILALTGIILLYVFYTKVDDCGLQKFFITFILIMSAAVSVVSIMPSVQERQPRSGLLQSSVVSLYATYLTWSALSSSSSHECNPGMFGIVGTTKSKVGFDQQAIVGLIIWMCCILYSSVRSASSSSKLTLSEHVLVKDGGVHSSMQGDASLIDNEERGLTEDTGRGGQKVWDNEDEGVAYSWSFFHLTFCLSTLYIMMTLTNWYQPNSSLETLNSNDASMWVKVISSWMCMGLYLWTLVAPVVCTNRVFN
ncbi:Serine incorporator 1 [Frankliniella fusca]|uniref:Serine incorporator 1 n=1 Tax=Frankliniella fusca TaxID=407009 RepID=A0AAE1H289_9NEOP|nr:Serine incorporator 1 [Frankliniella fusca]